MTDSPYGIRPPGTRLPDATRIGRVRLQVSDLAQSIAYYERVIGLATLHRHGGGAVLGPRDAEPLLELHERRGIQPVPRRGRLGLYHFAILLPDRAHLGRFLAHLADRGENPGMADHAVSEALYLQDPDNLGIEVYADRPRESWHHEGRELDMTTGPLAVRDLLAAGGGTAWSGIPPGTVIGHVHLHVGDLDRAAAFYHETLGLDKVVWSYPGALFLSAGGYHHHLGTNTWVAGAPSAGEGDARLLEWELVVPGASDVGEIARRLDARGYAVERDGGSVTAADPWGTPLRVRTG